MVPFLIRLNLLKGKMGHITEGISYEARALLNFYSKKMFL